MGVWTPTATDRHPHTPFRTPRHHSNADHHRNADLLTLCEEPTVLQSPIYSLFPRRRRRERGGQRRRERRTERERERGGQRERDRGQRGREKEEDREGERGGQSGRGRRKRT